MKIRSGGHSRTDQCPSRKRRYPDEYAANRVIALAQRFNPDGGNLPKRSYECPLCNGGWHLTSRDRYT